MIIGAAGGAIAAAGIGAAATVGTSMLAGGEGEAGAAASQAANEKLTKEQIQLAGQARDRANTYQKPYFNQGTAGQNRLAYLLGTSNVTETPTDTSFDAFRATVNSRQGELNLQLQQHLAKRPSPKNKKAFKAWQAQKVKLDKQVKTIGGQLKGGTTSVQYQKWRDTQPGTIKSELPKDASYGSLLADFGEKWVDPEFNFEADKGYQFRKEQGNLEMDKRLSAMGLASSGAALREGSRYNQGLADQTYNDAFNRFQTERGFDYGRFQDRFNQFNTEKSNKFNMLTSQSGIGQGAAGQMSSNENIYGQNVTGAKANENIATQANIADRTNASMAGYVAAGQGIAGAANNYLTYAGNAKAKQQKGGAAPKAPVPAARALAGGRRR